MAAWIDIPEFRHRREIEDLQKKAIDNLITAGSDLGKSCSYIDRLGEMDPKLYYEITNGEEYRKILNLVRKLSRGPRS